MIGEKALATAEATMEFKTEQLNNWSILRRSQTLQYKASSFPAIWTHFLARISINIS